MELDPEVECELAMRRAEIGKQYQVSAGLIGEQWGSVRGVLRSKRAKMRSDKGNLYWHIEGPDMHHFIAVDMIRHVDEISARMIW